MYPFSSFLNVAFFVLLTLQALVDPTPQHITFVYICGGITIYDIYTRVQTGQPLFDKPR